MTNAENSKFTPTRTPDYDPRKNSKFINWLLNAGIDGKYQRAEKLCEGASNSQLFSKSIKLAQFPLHTPKSLFVTTLLFLVFAVPGILCIVAAVLTTWPLWVLIPFAIIFLVFATFVGIFLVHKARLHHRYVFVELGGCDQCGKEHVVLYDAITKMKRRRFGRYTRETCETMREFTTRRSYDFIENVFEGMRNTLGPPIPGAYNCQHWADEMYAKLS